MQPQHVQDWVNNTGHQCQDAVNHKFSIQQTMFFCCAVCLVHTVKGDIHNRNHLVVNNYILLTCKCDSRIFEISCMKTLNGLEVQ